MLENQILHILPHFAPQQCGVSDYVLRWQEAMGTEKPYQILALYDRFLEGYKKMDRGQRLGRNLPVKVRVNALRDTINKKPAAIVFHYVPLGYGRRGLPFWLFRLSTILKNAACPVTILLHELWAGGPGKPLLLQGKGYLQKQLLVRWLRSLGQPRLITTTNYTAAMLRSIGFVADFCPVFNNLGHVVSPKGLAPDIVAACENPGILRIILFGSLPPEGSPEKVAGFLADMQIQHQCPVQVWHVGHGYPKEWWHQVECNLTMEERKCISFNQIGALKASEINYLMRNCHYGISTYPWQLWAKSGSIAAMRANGLPVWLVGYLADTKPPKEGELPTGLFYYEAGSHLTDPISLPSETTLYNEKIASTLFGLTAIGKPFPNTCPTFSVVITVYKSWAKALICLAHLEQYGSSDPILEIIIIDDFPDGEVPAEIPLANKVKIVKSHENLGYVKAVNKGISLAASAYVVLLDSDAYVKNSLIPLVGLLGSEVTAKLSTPQGIGQSGTKTRMFFPAPFKWSLLLGQKLEGAIQKKLSLPQPIIHSYAWGIYKPVWEKLGGLDEAFLFIESDIDYCVRLQHLFPGSVSFCPATTIQHDGGSSVFGQKNRVKEWYRSRFYMLSKANVIGGYNWVKQVVKLRLAAEKWVADCMGTLKPAEKEIWKEKKMGRTEILNQIKKW